MLLVSRFLDQLGSYTISLKVQLQVLKLLQQSLLLSPSGQLLFLVFLIWARFCTFNHNVVIIVTAALASAEGSHHWCFIFDSVLITVWFSYFIRIELMMYNFVKLTKLEDLATLLNT